MTVLTPPTPTTASTQHTLYICSEIGGNISEAEKQIAQYREELQQSREIRKHRQEYDALAQVRRQERREKDFLG